MCEEMCVCVCVCQDGLERVVLVLCVCVRTVLLGAYLRLIEFKKQTRSSIEESFSKWFPVSSTY